MCTGRLQQDSGKFHNHCHECPGFVKCIGDYREAHCGECGKPFFQGKSGFACPCRERGGGRGGFGGGVFDTFEGGNEGDY